MQFIEPLSRTLLLRRCNERIYEVLFQKQTSSDQWRNICAFRLGKSAPSWWTPFQVDIIVQHRGFHGSGNGACCLGFKQSMKPSELHLNISVWSWVGFWFNRFTNRMPNQQTQQDAPWCHRRHIVGISKCASSRDKANCSLDSVSIISRPVLQTELPRHCYQMTRFWSNTSQLTGVGYQRAINSQQNFSRPIKFPTWSAMLPFSYGWI